MAEVGADPTVQRHRPAPTEAQFPVSTQPVLPVRDVQVRGRLTELAREGPIQFSASYLVAPGRLVNRGHDAVCAFDALVCGVAWERVKNQRSEQNLEDTGRKGSIWNPQHGCLPISMHAGGRFVRCSTNRST